MPTEPRADDVDTDALVTVIERIMTQHWDMAACPCWVCVEGRAAGCRPREQYLGRLESGVTNPERRPAVKVDYR